MIGDRDNWNMENRHSRYRDLCQRVKNDYIGNCETHDVRL